MINFPVPPLPQMNTKTGKRQTVYRLIANLNTSLKVMLYFSPDSCESCVDLLFVRGAGNCPECGTPLRKSNFRVQLFEDPTVDKEVEIRKKVLKM